MDKQKVMSVRLYGDNAKWLEDNKKPGKSINTLINDAIEDYRKGKKK